MAKTRLVTLQRQNKIARVREALQEYLSTPGYVRASEAQKLIKEKIPYPTFCSYFREIMNDLQDDGKAEYSYGGQWRIFNLNPATGSGN